MNRLSIEKQVTVLTLLVEGNSIRSIERITGVNRNTIMSLMNRAAKKCQELSRLYFRGLTCEALEVDEAWTFCFKKEKKVKPEDNPEWGSQYVYVALDPQTKLVPLFTVGKRTHDTTMEFITELKRRVDSRFQLTTDYYQAYAFVVNYVFGNSIDYAQLQKMYSGNGSGREGYSPSEIVATESRTIIGDPKAENICTSYVERQNLTIRMHLKRFTRLSNAFSKKLENLKSALALYFFYYNFMKTHKTLRTTPAIEAKVTGTLWNWRDLLRVKVKNEGSN